MSANKCIRHILAAVLLLLPLYAVMASPACKGRSVACHAVRTTGHHRSATDVSTERHHHPHDVVLSEAGHLSSAANLQTGHSGTGSGFLEDYLAFGPSDLLLHNSSNTELRRWQLLSGVVHYAHLQALYPVHGFW